MKVRSYIQAYISENVSCNIFDKKIVIKKLSKKNLLSLLYHYSIYINVSSPNESIYKYDFLKKSMITLLPEFSVKA